MCCMSTNVIVWPSHEWESHDSVMHNPTYSVWHREYVIMQCNFTYCPSILTLCKIPKQIILKTSFSFLIFRNKSWRFVSTRQSASVLSRRRRGRHWELRPRSISSERSTKTSWLAADMMTSSYNRSALGHTTLKFARSAVILHGQHFLSFF